MIVYILKVAVPYSLGMAGWVVAVSHWNQESEAGSRLEQQGFQCYFPKFIDVVVVRGRRTEREQLLFGRYFFVNFIDTMWRSILGTRGVSDLLRHGEAPSVLRDTVIDEIRGRERNGYVIVPPHVKKSLHKGQAVRVKIGPLVDKIGIYQGMTRRGREIAALSFLGKMTRVELAAGSLVAA